jgi:hypothetical protein
MKPIEVPWLFASVKTSPNKTELLESVIGVSAAETGVKKFVGLRRQTTKEEIASERPANAPGFARPNFLSSFMGVSCQSSLAPISQESIKILSKDDLRSSDEDGQERGVAEATPSAALMRPITHRAGCRVERSPGYVI